MRRKRKPSATTVIACVALFFSLGGITLAASQPSGHYVATNSAPLAIAPGSSGEVIVSCGSGKPTEGGFRIDRGIDVTSSASDGHAWILTAANPTARTLHVLRVRVVCSRS